MNKSYVAHDCIICEGAVLSAGVLLGGRVEIGEYANLGLGVTIHQRTHVGKNAMIGMQAVVKKHILPYSVVAGNPGRILRFNRSAAQRKEMEEIYMSEMESLFYTGRFEGYQSDNPMWQEIKDFITNHPDSLDQLKA